jgi:hypothetical protein
MRFPNGLTAAAMLLFAGSATSFAAEKITMGPPKLVVDEGAQEGPSWDPTFRASVRMARWRW